MVQQYYGAAALNTTSYSAPIYTVAANQPTTNMSWNNCQGKTWEDPAFAAALRNVPIPANAQPSQGGDAEMVIYQPSTNTEWEFWEAGDSNGQWSACWGGMISDVSQNPGVFTNGLGVTGSGLPLLGGLIRVQDLQQGAIDHAIDLELPQIQAETFSWPASRTDGGSSDPDAPAEGERFRLPASLDLSQFNLSPGELMIARAMQQYGLIVTDGSGVVTLQAEDPTQFEVNGEGNPYNQYFSGPSYSWLAGLPWQDLQAVAWNYGQPGS